MFLLAWAAVGYASKFYRDLEMSNPIQLGLNLLNQLAIVLVLIYAGLYLFRWDDVSRTYVMLIGVVDFVLLIVGPIPVLQRHCLDATPPGSLPLLPDCRLRHPCARDGDSHRGKPWHGPRLVGFVDPNSGSSKLNDWFGHYEIFPVEMVEKILEDRVIDEVIFAVSHAGTGPP